MHVCVFRYAYICVCITHHDVGSVCLDSVPILTISVYLCISTLYLFIVFIALLFYPVSFHCCWAVLQQTNFSYGRLIKYYLILSYLIHIPQITLTSYRTCGLILKTLLEAKKIICYQNEHFPRFALFRREEGAGPAQSSRRRRPRRTQLLIKVSVLKQDIAVYRCTQGEQG